MKTLILFAAVFLSFLLAACRKSEETKERKIAYYQSSMHPWIKSDKPGTCTICGMKLTPIFEGEKGFEIEGHVVTLSSNGIQAVNVQSEPVQIRELERTLLVAGRIEADETRMRVLSAYADGRIEKLFVNYVGAEVRANEPLALIYSPSLLAAQREYLNLAARTNAGGEPLLADIQSLDQNEPDAATTRILAPISGTIISRHALEGQYVKEGDRLFELADLSSVWFRFDLYEQDLHRIKPGELVEITGPALGGERFSGRIAFIDPNLNDAVRGARVRVELENPVVGEGTEARRRFYNGLYAEGRIRVSVGKALAVPRSAVLDAGDYARVYLDHGGGAYEPRAVKIGRRGALYWEVLEGLEEDDIVVTNGNFLIDSQAQINQSAHAVSHSHEMHEESESP
jgi:Cu(I)/Ag(I) efflux system membrane fusion protein